MRRTVSPPRLLRSLGTISMVLLFSVLDPAHAAPEARSCTADPSSMEIQAHLKSLGSFGQCPATPGFAPLTNLHPATALLVGYLHAGGSRQLVKSLASWSLKQSPRLPIHVLVAGGRLNEAKSDLAELLAAPFDKVVHLFETDHRPTIWAQDMMEIGVRGGQPRPVILDLPTYVTDIADFVPQDFGAECKMPVIDQDKIGFESEADGGSVGGNVEGFPGGIAALGGNADAGLLTFFEEQMGGAKPVTVDLSWLTVAHIDEIVSLVPMKNSSCGFGLLRASPEEALKLYRSRSAQEQNDPIEPRKAATNALTAQQALAQADLVKLNMAYEKILEHEAQKLRQKIQNATKCNDVPVKALPVLFRRDGDFETNDSASLPPSSDLNPNPLNSLVLGQTIFVPEQPNSWLQATIGSRLKELGLEPVFVNVDAYHALKGHIHCGTNVVRTCAPTSVSSTVKRIDKPQPRQKGKADNFVTNPFGRVQ